MSATQELRKTVTDSLPFQALVGVTDLAVERVRVAVSDVEKMVGSFEPRDLPTVARQLPARAVSSATQTAAALADRAEATYAELTGRGKDLIERVRSQRATQDLIEQSRGTVSLARGAVSTARKAAAETASAAIGVVTQTRTEVQSAASKPTATAVNAGRKTAGTARKGAAATRSRTKAASTSARKSAAAARKAAASTAAKVGD